MITGTNSTNTVTNTGTGTWSTGMSMNIPIATNRIKTAGPMGIQLGVMKDSRMTTSIEHTVPAMVING